MYTAGRGLRILLVATAVGCAASLLTPQYSLVQVALMCLTVVLFVTCLALIFKYLPLPQLRQSDLPGGHGPSSPAPAAIEILSPARK